MFMIILIKPYLNKFKVFKKAKLGAANDKPHILSISKTKKTFTKYLSESLLAFVCRYISYLITP